MISFSFMKMNKCRRFLRGNFQRAWLPSRSKQVNFSRFYKTWNRKHHAYDLLYDWVSASRHAHNGYKKGRITQETHMFKKQWSFLEGAPCFQSFSVWSSSIIFLNLFSSCCSFGWSFISLRFRLFLVAFSFRIV